MANSVLVQQFSGNVIPGTICGKSTQIKFTSTTQTRGIVSLVTETNTSDTAGVRKIFLSHGFDNDTVDILMASWRKGTFCNHSLYMIKWFKFSSCNKVSPVEPPVQVALAFMTLSVKQEKSFNQIFMVRSALSSVINQEQNNRYGNTPIVKKYMKGIFKNNPTLPNFQFKGNVSLLFKSFHNIQEIQALNIQKLIQKLVMLTELISLGQRVQTIHSIRVSDIKILDNEIFIPIMFLIKQTKPI